MGFEALIAYTAEHEPSAELSKNLILVAGHKGQTVRFTLINRNLPAISNSTVDIPKSVV